MRAHLVQPDTVWEDRDANYLAVERLLDAVDVREGDLVALPEMFDTGFTMDTARSADWDGRTAGFLAELAEDLGCTVIGGRTTRACTRTACMAENRYTAFGPGDGGGAGLLLDYAKIHPFAPGGEDKVVRPGDRVETFTWEGARGERTTVCPAVCFDLRFPELFRIGAARHGAEVFVIGANWPAARMEHWRTLLTARAIENQAFVLGVNRAGEDPATPYAGGTAAYGPGGELLGELETEAGSLTVELDFGESRRLRAGFGVLGESRLLGLGDGGAREQ